MVRLVASAGRRDPPLVFSVTEEDLERVFVPVEGATEVTALLDLTGATALPDRVLERERDLALASRMICFVSSLALLRRVREEDRARACSTRLGLSGRLVLLVCLATTGAGFPSTPRADMRVSFDFDLVLGDSSCELVTLGGGWLG